MDVVKTIVWKDDKVIILDQRRLPLSEVYNTYEDYKGVADAIKHMAIRGAPAIGVAAAMGIALGALGIALKNYDEFYKRLQRICDTMARTRPTAINLFWAIERMKAVCLLNKDRSIKEIQNALKEEALRIYHEDIEANRSIGRSGQVLFSDGDSVLTHCNAGALATAGYGTALGVLYAAQENGKTLKVYADETRPFLQGARLTAWELQKHGMDVTVITDNMAGSLMKKKMITKVIVGADRIAANGDVANKIGTYSVAVLAEKHDIPFYVAAPISSIDPEIKDGSLIPIEERDPMEVTHIQQFQITPDYVKILNPAFDITPNELITAIITERGIVKPPYKESIQKLLEG